MDDGVLLVGAGGMAQMIVEYLERDGVQISRITVDRKYISEGRYKGYGIEAFEDVAREDGRGRPALVAIGYAGMNGVRAEKCKALSDAGFRLVDYISPKAQVYGASIATGNVIVLDNAILEPLCAVEKGVVIWPGAVISHHSRMREYSMACSNSAVAGNAEIGAYSFIGICAGVREGVRLGARTFLGIGAYAAADSEPGTVILPAVPRRPGADSAAYLDGR